MGKNERQETEAEEPKTREPEKVREGKEQTNEESETMTKSKKMNANYQEHDSKNQNKGGFFRFVLPLFWILQMLNFASHF
jgi:hypothetical protein